MKRVFSILTFIALTMAIGTPSGLAAIGKVLYLDGEGDFVSLNGSSYTPKPSTAITIEAWVFSSGSDDSQSIFAATSSANGGVIHFEINPNGVIRWCLKSNDGETFFNINAGNITFNEWHHIAGTYDKNLEISRLFLDGHEISDSSGNQNVPDNWDNGADIGAFFVNHRYFNGAIDEVRIWNIARTQEEIQDAMNRTLTSDEINSGNVAGYWNFDDGTADDLSPNSNHGTLMGDARIGDFMAIFAAEPRWGEAPLTIQFTDCSYGENITDWYWEFGDGDTSVEQNPIHEYQNAGDYTVSLTITSPTDFDTVTRSEYIHVGDHLEWDTPVVGTIDPPGEVDLFCFSANAGDIIVLDIDAQLNGSPLNSYLRLYDESGREVAYNNDTPGSLDSMIVYPISTDGTYCVEVGDVDGNGGSDYFYILFLRRGTSISGNVVTEVDAIPVPLQEEQQYAPVYMPSVYAEDVDTEQQFSTSWMNYNGDYTIFAPEGSYRVKIQTSADTLQYYKEVTEPSDATVIDITADEPATDIDFFLNLAEYGYITQGLVLGPLKDTGSDPEAITQDFLVSIGGEANVIPREGDTFEFKSDVLTWQPYNFGIGWIFTQIFETHDFDTAYLATYLKFDKSEKVDVWTGHSDAIAIWLNGENVWTKTTWASWDADKFQITVRKGWNRMLVKVMNVDGHSSWGMSVRFPNVRPIDISLNPDVFKTIGDVSGDGTISAYDASLILQFVVGLIDTLPPTVQSPVDGVLRDYSVSIPELKTRPTDSIKVPVAINDATGLANGGIILKYDQSVIRAVDALPTSMLSGAYWKANTQRVGEIRFAFAAVEPIKGAGNLLTVEFEPLNDTAGRESSIIFETVQFVESQSIRTIDGKVTILPEKSMLLQNYPNPFNPETWIPYQLAEDSPVTISIYNAKGELVRTLNLGYQSAGIYIAKSKAAYWNGKDNLGEKVANGVYFYSLQAGNFSSMRKLVVLK